jgi:hypothetical protein
MALPKNIPFDVVQVEGGAASVDNGGNGCVRAPFRGTVLEVGTIIGSAVSTADATVTTSIAGTDITGGQFTITQSGSSAGQLNNAFPTGANFCNEGDSIRFAFSGSGTGGGQVYCYAVIKPRQ